mmetsp:Transcript_27082/g.59182  ORF Transcript_27082/g.59182 Transcript_27082/m.59182 type:complete len:84 (-) Transcript_27082:107-358(-)
MEHAWHNHQNLNACIAHRSLPTQAQLLPSTVELQAAQHSAARCTAFESVQPCQDVGWERTHAQDVMTKSSSKAMTRLLRHGCK